MPRLMRIRQLIAVVSLLALAACGKSAGTVDNNPTGPVYGPATPAATAVGTASPAELPTVTGGLGVAPTVTFPASGPPPKLQRSILVEGTGKPIETGDLMVSNYYGIIWGADKPFNNSYDQKKTVSFRIGVNAVVKGWDVGLLGVKTGSRVLLTLSPSEGYGLTGSTDVGIKGTDTIVFVIDVLAALGTQEFGQADAVLQTPPANSPTVVGAPGTEPTLSFPPGLAEPTAPKLDIIAKGNGAPVAYGNVYLQFTAYDWTGVQQGATWQSTGAQEVPLSAEQTQLQGLVGVPVGSRVLLQVPADEENSTPAVAYVMDVIYQPTPVA